MNTAQLSRMCRCGHARRWHEMGNIFVGFRNHCLMSHHDGPEVTDSEFKGRGCLEFEVVEGWQEHYAALLRKEGYVVERVARDARGRFVRTTGDAA